MRQLAVRADAATRSTPRRNTGGSSGGCAAAVADGLLTFAEGTDGGGSIRIPASWCGVYGYKQSFGRVPFVVAPERLRRDGPVPLRGAAHAHGRGRRARARPRSPATTRATRSALDEPVDFTGARRARSIKGMRIAYTPDFDVFPVDRRIAAVVDDAVQAFEEAGAHVEEVEARDRARPARAVGPLVPADHADQRRARVEGAAGSTCGYDVSDDLPAAVPRWLDRGYELTALDIARDQAMRTEVFDAFQDVFAATTCSSARRSRRLPVKNARRRQHRRPERGRGRRRRSADRLVPDLPRSTTPATRRRRSPPGSPTGCRSGMQIIGRRHADADVLAASAAFERLRRGMRPTRSRPGARLPLLRTRRHRHAGGASRSRSKRRCETGPASSGTRRRWRHSTGDPSVPRASA